MMHGRKNIKLQIINVLHCADINKTRNPSIFGGNILYRILCISNEEYGKMGKI